jgi:hypothetical protein
MGLSGDKWFSMRTDFFGRDSYQLGICHLSERSIGVYVACIAYACQWGLDYVPRGIFRGIAGPRSVTRRELLEHGFLVRGLDSGTFHVAHEGTLWRRGTPLTRRTIPLAVRSKVMERDGYQCVECEATDWLTLDHIWPYSKGGQDTVENLRVLCRSCNSAKGARV